MSLIDVSYLIHVGAVMYVIAFLARDELHLRLLALAGSSMYVMYYFFFPAEPLWDAILSSSVLICANLVILSRVLFERTILALSEDEKSLFAAFDTLTPGQFRKILKIAHWQLASHNTTLTREGEALKSLFYIFDGSVLIEKSNHSFTLPDDNFLGEIAYIRGGKPTATAAATAATRYIAWDIDALRQLSTKDPKLNNALVALLARDLADKLSSSHQLG